MGNLLINNAMNKIVIACLIGVSLLVGCNTPPEGFEVRIRLENLPQGRIYVSERIPHPTQWFIDTLEVTGGELLYTGKVDYPRLTTFSFWEGEEGFRGNITVFLDNSRVDVTGDFNHLKEVTVTGSPAHAEYLRIEKEGEEVFGCYRRLGHERSRAFKDNRALYDSLGEPYRDAYDRVVAYLIGLPGYATSEVAPYFVTENIPTERVDDLERALAAVDPSLYDNAYVADLREKLQREKGASPGRPAYDFTLADLEGNSYTLSDFRGKYVLLEFSASWCGWCKLEIPYLQTVYENTRGKAFELFTINLDEEREKWEYDVREHPVPWPVISDLQGFKGELTKRYNVSGIPMIFLIDPDGIILEKGLRREAMISYVNTLFTANAQDSTLVKTEVSIDGKTFIKNDGKRIYNKLNQSQSVVARNQTTTPPEWEMHELYSKLYLLNKDHEVKALLRNNFPVQVIDTFGEEKITMTVRIDSRGEVYSVEYWINKGSPLYDIDMKIYSDLEDAIKLNFRFNIRNVSVPSYTFTFPAFKIAQLLGEERLFPESVYKERR